MIYGIGTDIVSIERIRDLVGKSGPALALRILTDKEMQSYAKLFDDQAIFFLAKKFAAKEAISKAIGTGIGETLSFKDIEIFNAENGKPMAHVRKFENLRIQISLSDEKDSFAIAFAIAEK